MFEIDKSECLTYARLLALDDAVFDQKLREILSRLFLNPILCESAWARTAVFKAMNRSLEHGLIPGGEGILATCVFLNLNPDGHDSSLPADSGLPSDELQQDELQQQVA